MKDRDIEGKVFSHLRWFHLWVLYMGSTSLFKGFSQHSERTFKKLSTSSPKRLLVNIFKNVPEKRRKE